jgi:hypothetical protein
MRTTQHRRLRGTAWILAVALAFCGIAEAGPAVLCVGNDGHSDVEYSLAGCCVLETDEADQLNSTAKMAGRTGCDDCVDLGLDQNSLTVGKKLLPTPEVTMLRVTLTRGGSKGAFAPAAARNIDRESLTTALSSIVLLI